MLAVTEIVQRNYIIQAARGPGCAGRIRTMYVYVESEKGLWTVGFYAPKGQWNPESDHATKEAAAERVHYLNGGNEPEERCHIEPTFVGGG